MPPVMRLSSADLKSLVVFRAVVEHRGFVGAQVALNLGQPAVSFHIKSLEERAGFRLCRRGRGGFSLTEKGDALYEHSKALFAALSVFESALGELRQTIGGVLRLGVVDNTVTDPGLPLHRAVGGFLRRAPEARLDIVVATPEQLLADISAGGLDLAVMPEMSSFRGLAARAFYAETHVLYAGAEHSIWRVSRLDKAEVERWPFIVRPYANLRDLQHFRGAHAAAAASNMEAQAIFILSGELIGYLPEHYAQRWVETGQLRAVMPETARISSPFFIVTRSQKEQPLLLLSAFEKALNDAMGRKSPGHDAGS